MTWHFLFRLTVVALLFFGASESVDVECSYETKSWDVIGDQHTCKVQNSLNIISTESSVIKAATGSGNNTAVTFFNADNKGPIHYFPRGLDKIFASLIGIRIIGGGLKELHQSDLQPLPNLRYIRLENNNIEILENGLFDYNPKLEYVDFDENKLVHIGANVFDNLSQLTELWLKSNPCINNRGKNKADVKSLISEATGKCQSHEILLRPKFQEIIQSIQNMQTKIEADQKSILADLTSKMTALEAKLMTEMTSIVNMLANVTKSV